MSKSSHSSEINVARWMETLVAETSTNAPLPDPHLLWLKAQLEERAELRERALRPIAIAEKVAVVLLTLLGAAVLMAAAPLVESWSNQMTEPETFAWSVAAICLIAIGYAFIWKPLVTND